MNSLKEILKKEIKEKIIDLKESSDVSGLSTMRLQAAGDLVTVKSLDALKRVLKILSKNKKKYIVIGMGSNLLLPKKTKVVYLKLKFGFDYNYLNNPKEKYTLPAFLPLKALTDHSRKFCIKGFEGLAGIPGTIGGAIIINAGTALGEIKDVVKEVKIIKMNGEVKVVKIVENSFSYRKNHFLEEGDVIYEVELVPLGKNDNIPKLISEHLKKRAITQPVDKRTCGCTFKNYSEIIKAGKYLEILGMKGLTHGALSIDKRHANFIVNENSGTIDDFYALIEVVQKEVYLNYGVKFELEAITFD